MRQRSVGISSTPDPVTETSRARVRLSPAAARQRLRSALRERVTRTSIVVAIAMAIVGFGVASFIDGDGSDDILATARTEDLIRILDDLGAREQRLEAERRELDITAERLRAGNPEAALTDAQERVQSLEVLAGIVPVTGPGVRIVIADPNGVVDSTILLDAIQELRDAGAEAISIGQVRVTASTWLDDSPRGIVVDGQLVTFPVSILAIGDPPGLTTALEIPGGVSDTVRTVNGRIAISQSGALVIDAIAP